MSKNAYGVAIAPLSPKGHYDIGKVDCFPEQSNIRFRGASLL